MMGIRIIFTVCIIAIAISFGMAQAYETVTYDSEIYYEKDPDTELLVAAYDGDTSEVRKWLNKGADINTVSYSEGLTALMYAAQNNHLEVVKMLIADSAAIDIKDYEGMTALIFATLFHNDTVAEYLIQNNAKIDLGDKNGVTSLMYGAVSNYFIMTDMLLYYGADILAKNEKGVDAIQAAALKGNYEIVDLLISKGANVNSNDELGYTPLMNAAQTNDTISIDLLLKNGAIINALSNNEMTALTIASKYENTEAVRLLLDRGAAVNLAIDGTDRNISNLSYAKNREIKKILLEKGAQRDFKPDFNNSSIGLGMDGNFNDFMFDLNGGVQERRTNMGIYAGLTFRPFRKRVLYKIEEDLYYQYKEWRSFLYIGIEKRFTIIAYQNKKYGLFGGIKGTYTFGSLKATGKKAKNGFHIIPQAGLYVAKENTIVRLGYEYLKLDMYKVSPHRIYFGIFFLINNASYSSNRKIDDWLSK